MDKKWLIRKKYFEQRGNWRPYQLSEEKGSVDFLYSVSGSKYDKRLFTLKSLLRNITVKRGIKMTDKNLLFEELEQIPAAKKYLMENYYIDVKNINMYKVEKMFEKYGVLIFKPVHGYTGVGIEVFDDINNILNIFSLLRTVKTLITM